MTLGLRARWSLTLGGLLTMVFAVGSIGIYLSERAGLLQQAADSRKALVRQFAQACADALLVEDDLALLNAADALCKMPMVGKAYCRDPRGRTLGTASDTAAPQKHDLLLVEAPVDVRPGERGAAVVGFKKSVIEGEVRESLQKAAHRIVGMSTLALALGIGAAFLLAGQFVKPIRRMAQATRRLAKGLWDTQVPESAPGELGELAQQFNHMARQLGELDQLKDHFIHAVSHDLRNPLSAIVSSAKLLLKGDPTTRALGEVIETSAVRLRTMVNNILDTARLREGKLQFSISVFPVDKILGELKRLYQPLAEESMKTLALRLPDNLPNLAADEEKTLRVFLNLLGNAFKFTREKDTITISAQVRGPWVEFRVEDTGPGIGPDRLPHIFEPYRSTEGDPDFRRQGTGLGLSIIKTLIEGHGGGLRVESTLGKGTAVIFTLPGEGAR